MHISKNIVINRANKTPLLADVFYSKNIDNQPVVIFCHGYKGFKDWGAWHIMGKQIAQAGFCFVKFNFSHNGGTVENPIDFPDLEAFGNNNYTKEIDDLNDLMDWIQLNLKTNVSVDISKIFVLGHSRGGGISILKTAEDSRIKKLVTLSSVSDFSTRFGTPKDIQDWKDKGVKYVLNGRTKQQMPHYYQFYEDFKANEDRLSIKKASQRIDVPQLIIHGNVDSSVKIDEAYALNTWNPKSQLQIIENADHVFNIRHPWLEELPTAEFQNVIGSILRFLK